MAVRRWLTVESGYRQLLSLAALTPGRDPMTPRCGRTVVGVRERGAAARQPLQQTRRSPMEGKATEGMDEYLSPTGYRDSDTEEIKDARRDIVQDSCTARRSRAGRSLKRPASSRQL